MDASNAPDDPLKWEPRKIALATTTASRASRTNCCDWMSMLAPRGPLSWDSAGRVLPRPIDPDRARRALCLANDLDEASLELTHSGAQRMDVVVVVEDGILEEVV